MANRTRLLDHSTRQTSATCRCDSMIKCERMDLDQSDPLNDHYTLAVDSNTMSYLLKFLGIIIGLCLLCVGVRGPTYTSRADDDLHVLMMLIRSRLIV